ncbi:tripartite motif-containing protein 66 isoform X2 [Xiphias gladius]|uniref:tripartite motif-containing protein 66 isoform X2 n=1 Tax=Xiphias gladius TaxID=8245 RepID=UPI001A990BE9|nr:tripartite motif-containing protein 66 isoform X2 [Xiphias gladius]
MEKSCSECSEPTLAQSLCTLCNKWLCYQCTDVHQHHRGPATSQYTDLHQQQRPSATQCPDLHQRGSSSLPPTGQGPGSYPCSLLMCHSHRQEPLELFCESCDLLCCSSCHLSSHKNHRVVQIGKALQDQQWLFESLMVQVEERRSAVENNAKQIEGRLHGVKIAHRKAENQIKMAKMIMMNELNKRANLLIEQLEKISEDFQQRLEDQLQGAIEICGQLDHVQKFITWATTHHRRGPVLFSRALISLQMQQLLEPSLQSDSWSPVKIKFNWDASYWMKQISSLGQLTVEGGSCTYPQGLACSSIMRPQPITCLALPSVFRRREPGCGYQACCEPQMCCLHDIPSHPDLPSLDKSELEAKLYNSSCVQPALIPASLHQSQQLQRCWDTDSSSHCPPPTSPVPTIGPIQLNCSRGPTSQPQAADSQPHSQPKSYLSYHHQREILPDSQAQLSANRSRPGQCQGKLSFSPTMQQELSHTAVDRDVMTEGSWEERCRVEETCGHTAVVESRQLLDEELQQDRSEQSHVQQLLQQPQQPQQQQQQQQQQQRRVPTAADLRKEQQGTRPALSLRDHRDGRSESYIPLPRGMDQRSTSLEVSVTAHDYVPDVQSSGRSPSSACTRRKRRSQSIPAELAAPSTSPYTERPTGWTHSLEAGAANKYSSMDPRQRRASDGVLCVVKEISSDMAVPRGQCSHLLSYKTEPDHSFTNVNEEIDYEDKEKCRMSRNGHNSRDVQKDSGRPRVPVVCLERLKILISQLPPHGRRQSDPLPASSMEKSETLPQQRTWHDVMPQGIAVGSETRRTTRSLTAPPYAAERQTYHQSSTQSTNSEFDSRGRFSSRRASTLPSTDPKYVPESYSALDLESDSDPRSVSEDTVVSRADPDPEMDSDASPDSEPNAESSSEAELECLAEEKSVAAGEMGLCGDTDIAGYSEPSLEYEADPESDAEVGSEDGQGLDADSESRDADTESDIQPEYDPRFQAESDSNVVSDQPPDSQGSVESELDVESEPELTTDDPQPLRSDLEEESHIGPGQRPLLIANPVAQRGTEEVQPEQDSAEMESEDFCAVCLIGGDLLCCDRCPKVFHLSCHIPSLLSFPSGDWVCSLCRNVLQPEVGYDCENERASGEHKSAHGLTLCDQRKCERLTLLILSNILSAPFHEPVSPLARHYYQIIKRPMDLSVIRAKLNKRNPRHYNSPDQFVADVYLMFNNCAKFNYPDSEVAQAGRSLEAFFTSKLKEVFPDRVFAAAEADSDSDEYDEAYRAAESGFPWPERREQCHRKRKRRNSLKSRRHYF